MEPTYITALAGLAGAMVGGLTSLVTAWVLQRWQLREHKLEALRREREKIFLEFIDEASRLYGDALSHEKDDVCDLVRLYALLAHLQLISSEAIVKAATSTIGSITQLYLAPNRTMREMADFAAGGGFEPVRRFSELCRAELLLLQGPLPIGTPRAVGAYTNV